MENEEIRIEGALVEDPDVFFLRDESGYEESVDGFGKTAREIAEEWIEEWINEGVWNFEDNKSVVVIVTSWQEGIDENGETVKVNEGYHLVAVDPPSPHDTPDWKSPQEIVGGIEENPGVQGSGGGVWIHEVDANSGWNKITDTWDQSAATNGMPATTVQYIEPYEDTIRWAIRQHELEVRLPSEVETNEIVGEVAERIESLLDENGFEHYEIAGGDDDSASVYFADEDELSDELVRALEYENLDGTIEEIIEEILGEKKLADDMGMDGPELPPQSSPSM